MLEMQKQKNHATVVAVAVLLGAVIWTALAATSAPAPAPTPRPAGARVKGWEYAQFSVFDSADLQTYKFITPTTRAEGNTLAALYAKLMGKAPAKDADCTYLDILNIVGPQGWELIQQTYEDNRTLQAKTSRFIFKRPVE